VVRNMSWDLSGMLEGIGVWSANRCGRHSGKRKTAEFEMRNPTETTCLHTQHGYRTAADFFECMWHWHSLDKPRAISWPQWRNSG
jgi:hypothetical protein